MPIILMKGLKSNPIQILQLSSNASCFSWRAIDSIHTIGISQNAFLIAPSDLSYFQYNLSVFLDFKVLISMTLQDFFPFRFLGVIFSFNF
jgi:hypothetical protein